MPNYVVRTVAPANFLPGQFFQPGATRNGTPPSLTTFLNPSGSFVSMEGSGFAYVGDTNVPTAGTVTAITLYAPDFTVQWAAFSNLSVSLVDLYNVWLGGTPGDVFTFLLGGNDIVQGEARNDVLLGHDGNDTISGGDGNDYIEPGRGTDTIDGEGGVDMLSYSTLYSDAATTNGITLDLNATSLTDPWGFTDTFANIESVRGTRFADVMTGNAANNTFQGLGGNDSFTGGTGFDTISYSDDVLFGGSKGVTVNFLTGIATDGFGNTDGFSGFEGATGTSQADTFIGGSTAQIGTGSYSIFAGGGDDIITAGSAGTFIQPGAGNDTITAGGGFDQISYGEYNGAKGAIFDFAKNTISDPYGNTDTLVGAFEAARGTLNADKFIGNAVNNSFFGLGGADSYDGGAGADRVRYDGDASAGGNKGVTVNLALGTATDGFGNSETLVSIEEAQGTELADTLTGGDTALTDGNVYYLSAGGGDDTLTAGKYDTILQPGAGNDKVTGGAGFDQISYEEYTGANGAVVNLATGEVIDPYLGKDALFGSIELVRGTRNADTITGNSSNNSFRALAGNDKIDGGGGTDQVRYDRDVNAGGTKGVVVNLATGKATDGFGDTDTLISIENVRGTAQADTLTGDANNNAFQGFGGADKIDGDLGQDTADYSADTLGAGITGVTVNLTTGKATDGSGAADTLISIEAARGTTGNDTLTGGSAAIVGQAYELYGGAGNDKIASGGYDIYVEPGAGNDTVTAGAGFDQVSYAEYSGVNGAAINLATGVVNDPYGGTDTLVGLFEGARGTRNADTITGNALNNQFRGLGGADKFDGGDGLDRLRYDRDAQYGGSKGVVVDLAKGTATDGFGAADSFISVEQVEGTAQADTLTGGDVGLGLGAAYDLLARGGDDTLIGGAAAAYFEPGAGNDSIKGGAGLSDQISYADFTGGNGFTIDLTKASFVDPFGNTDTFSGIEGVRGTAHGDTMTGDGISNFFAGLNGADVIDGGGGTADLVRYDRDAQYGGDAGVLVSLAGGVARDGFGSFDSLKNIENVRGSNALTGNVIDIGGTPTVFGDLLVGNDGDNLFQGLGGDDYIDGQGGSDTADYSRDTVEGGAAGVAVNLATGKATDGSGKSDTLVSIENVIGTTAADTLTGNAGANSFTGGLGDDTIIGGGGSDTAVFAGLRASYTIAAGAGGAIVVTGADGKDTLSNIGFLQFSDTKLSTAPAVFSIAVAPGSIAEGTGAGTTNFIATVSRTGGTALPLTIGWSVAGVGGGGTVAAAAADFLGGVLPSGSVSFASGETSRTITIGIARDAVVELNERFEVSLGAPPAGASVGTGTGAGIILNDDVAATSFAIATAAATVVEGNSGSAAAVFTVTRSGTTTGTNAVNFAVTGSGASPADAADFAGGVLPAGTLTFAAGETIKTITVSIAGDTTAEPDEGFTISLAGATNGATITTATASRTILSDDATLSISALSASKAEGTGGTTPFTFTISRTGGLAGASSATWAVAGAAGSGTVPAGAADFAGGAFPGGTVSFAAGEASKIITVNVDADVVGELNERFAVTLSAPTGAVLGAASAQGVIVNDDSSFAVTATTGDQTEGNAGSKSFLFTVQRNGTTTTAQNVTWVVAGASPHPATAADFVGGVLPGGTLSFLAGETSKVVTVQVLGDTTVEPDEQFQVVLSNPTNGAAIGIGSSAVRTIISDDSSLTITPLSASKPEGTGGTTAFTFTVARTGGIGVAQGATWTVAGAAGSGTVPATASDFAGGAFPGGAVSFAAGEASKIITVNVDADVAGELNERFAVTLSAPTGGAVIGLASAQGVVLNDDTSFQVAAATANQAEGNSGTSTYVFTVSRTGTLTAPGKVDYAVAGTGGSPANAADFLGGVLPAGTLSFLAGEGSKLVTVTVLGDTTLEPDEGFQLQLSNATGGAIAVASLARTILADEATLSITATSATKAEGTGGTTPFTFTVTRTGGLAGASSASWTVAGAAGSGTVPAQASDFAGGVFPAGTVSFAAGETSKVVTINVAGDTAYELNERFSVTLSAASVGTTIGTASAQGILLDDDTIYSTAANETLTGDADPNLFLLGGGVDTVFALGGLDVFRFQPTAIGTAATTATTIEDFNRALGEKLDLAAIDANAIGGLANDPFSFIGTAAFNAPGQLRWQDNGTDRLIQGNVNTDPAADLTIIVKAAGPIDATWFTL